MTTDTTSAEAFSTPSAVRTESVAPTSGGWTPLVLGFGTAVFMWWICYVVSLPVVQLHPRFTVPLLVICLGYCGYLAARGAEKPLARAAVTGTVTSLINLLIIGSVVGSQSDPAALGLWLGGSVLFGVVIAVGGAQFARLKPEGSRLKYGQSAFTKIWVAATFLVIVIGGVVTSEEAGMAVPDWPTTEGVNMFLYPLSKMTGGVYYEHTHRLFGSLVGLTSLVGAFLLFFTEARRWVIGLGAAALLLVSAQGVLGGLRVELDNDYGNLLRVIHGINGQLVFALVVILAVLSSRRWRQSLDPGLPNERIAAAGLTLAVIGQLILGALLRHISRDTFLLPHLGFAFAIVGAGFYVTLRWTTQVDKGHPILGYSRAIAGALGVQLAFGFLALGMTADEISSPMATLAATTHQAFGAVVLALVTGATLWTLRPSESRLKSSG